MGFTNNFTAGLSGLALIVNLSCASTLKSPPRETPRAEFSSSTAIPQQYLGKNVFGRDLKDHLNEYILIDRQSNVPLRNIMAFCACALENEGIAVYGTQNLAEEAAKYLETAKGVQLDYSGRASGHFKAVHLTPEIISQYVTGRLNTGELIPK